MKRLFAIGLSLFMLVGFSTNAIAISDCDKQLIVDLIESYKEGEKGKENFSQWVALVEAPNGCWQYFIAPTKRNAEKAAKVRCKKESWCNQRCDVVLTGRLYSHNNYLDDNEYLRDRGPCDCATVASNSTPAQTPKTSATKQSQAEPADARLIGIGTGFEVPKQAEAPKQIAGDGAVAVLYREVGKGKHKEWFANGDEEKHVKYVGEIKDGLPHGFGKSCLKIEELQSIRRIYTGEWKNGAPDGQGIGVNHELVRAEGPFKDGRPHGRVLLRRPFGSAFIGRSVEFKDGVVQ